MIRASRGTLPFLAVSIGLPAAFSACCFLLLFRVPQTLGLPLFLITCAMYLVGLPYAGRWLYRRPFRWWPTPLPGAAPDRHPAPKEPALLLPLPDKCGACGKPLSAGDAAMIVLTLRMPDPAEPNVQPVLVMASAFCGICGPDIISAGPALRPVTLRPDGWRTDN